MYSERILSFGNKLKGRLEGSLLEGALGYVKCNEESLALEILCDHISEYDVSLSNEEYEEIRLLIVDMGFDVGGAPFKYLQGLITPIVEWSENGTA
ncbi:MafI family immunity protein [Pseudomonas sp. KCJK9016]|uniref:MafI family immunity protein n=1 Tax=Pseudomonas sp. KCJK9016 TaxID=3344556 RepID=UPI003905F92D